MNDTAMEVARQRIQRAWRLADAYAVMTVESGDRAPHLGRHAWNVSCLLDERGRSPEELDMNRELLQHALDRRLVSRDPHHQQVLHVLCHRS